MLNLIVNLSYRLASDRVEKRHDYIMMLQQVMGAASVVTGHLLNLYLRFPFNFKLISYLHRSIKYPTQSFVIISYVKSVLFLLIFC